MTESDVRSCAGLDHALHGIVVRELAHVAAAVLDDVDFIAVVQRLDGRKGDARFGPEPRQDDLFPTGSLIAATKF